MKRQLSYLTVVCILMLIFYSCKKTDNQLNSPQHNNSVVPVELANQVAEKFDIGKYLPNQNNLSKQNTSSSYLLHGKNKIKNQLILKDKNGLPAIYVFNFENNGGFVFVAADYNLRPILAFIENGEFDGIKMPEGFQDWINRTKENTEIVREGKYDNKIVGALAWWNYIKEYGVDTAVLAGKPAPIDPDPNPCDNPPPPVSYMKGPLLSTTWGQSCSYNDLCALNLNFNCTNLGCGTGRPLTGCVATSMSQVMRYNQFPSTYNYSTMPNASGNNAVQALMRDAGNSVSMQYGCNSSGAYVNTVVPALKDHFGYSSANCWSYSNTSYNQGYGRVKDNINNYNLPVILAGSDNLVGGHMWVCDGTLSTTYYFGNCGTGNSSASYLNFHMNWGWHEIFGNSDYNGWFAFDNWTIYGLNYNFQYSKYGITEIHP